MNTTKIIVNPYADRWKAKAAIPDIERVCQKIGLDYELVITEGPNHGIELAREAALGGFSPIIDAGGDGSISEVVNGLMQAAGAGAEHSRSMEPEGRNTAPAAAAFSALS